MLNAFSIRFRGGESIFSQSLFSVNFPAGVSHDKSKSYQCYGSGVGALPVTDWGSVGLVRAGALDAPEIVDAGSLGRLRGPRKRFKNAECLKAVWLERCSTRFSLACQPKPTPGIP